MARQVIAQGGTEPADDADARLAAEALLQRTEPDAFLLVVGMLGLGLTVWLVYNYIL